MRDALKAQLQSAEKIAATANHKLPFDKQTDKVRLAIVEANRLRKMLSMI